MNSKVSLSSAHTRPRPPPPKLCPHLHVAPAWPPLRPLASPLVHRGHLSMSRYEPLPLCLDFPWLLRNSPSAVLRFHQSLGFSSPCSGDIMVTPKESYQGAPPLECKWDLPLASCQHNMAKGRPVTILVAEGTFCCWCWSDWLSGVGHGHGLPSDSQGNPDPSIHNYKEPSPAHKLGLGGKP